MEKWPPLPTQVFDVAGGAVRVVYVANLVHEDGDKCDGLWAEATRTITLEKSLSPERKWWTFHHEWMEMMISDAGMDYLIPEKMKEALCSVYATTKIAELRRAVGTKPKRKRKPAP